MNKKFASFIKSGIEMLELRNPPATSLQMNLIGDFLNYWVMNPIKLPVYTALYVPVAISVKLLECVVGEIDMVNIKKKLDTHIDPVKIECRKFEKMIDNAISKNDFTQVNEKLATMPYDNKISQYIISYGLGLACQMNDWNTFFNIFTNVKVKDSAEFDQLFNKSLQTAVKLNSFVILEKISENEDIRQHAINNKFTYKANVREVYNNAVKGFDIKYEIMSMIDSGGLNTVELTQVDIQMPKLKQKI